MSTDHFLKAKADLSSQYRTERRSAANAEKQAHGFAWASGHTGLTVPWMGTVDSSGPGPGLCCRISTTGSQGRCVPSSSKIRSCHWTPPDASVF